MEQRLGQVLQVIAVHSGPLFVKLRSASKSPLGGIHVIVWLMVFVGWQS